MNFSKRNRSIVDFLFILALFGAFAITGLLVVLFGSKVYQSTVEKMDKNYAARTALSYVTEKVRSHDYTNGIEAADIEVSEKNGYSVLLLKETVNDKTYNTYMYVADGMLKEFTADENYDFNYDAGTDILEIKEFTINKINDSLYKFTIVDSYDDSTQFFVSVLSETDGEE